MCDDVEAERARLAELGVATDDVTDERLGRSDLRSTCPGFGKLGLYQPSSSRAGAHMTAITDEVRAVLEGDGLAHLVTINADGSPQVSIVWVGIEDGDIVFASLMDRDQAQEHPARPARVAVDRDRRTSTRAGCGSTSSSTAAARITEGGGPELLQRLAHVYLGPDVKFPPMDDPPAGWIGRIAPERFGGVGPWA